jgi:2-polyprenyl-3-methyl-5-hydroxy-6-metoxy-1,4-benzoquinol methylase
MEDFAAKLTEILNQGAMNLALGIGYKNRIFDTLEDIGKPVTIGTLAAATRLDARYLREWLGIMVTGRIIDLAENPDGEDTYFLPPERAAFLTRRAGSNNLGVYTQEIPLLTACALEAVNAGFTTGDGVPFTTYPDFQQFMAQLADAKHEKMLVSEFLPSVDDGKLIQRLADGIQVCDLGCGEGVAVNLMARAFPQSTFTGIDNHPEAIASARQKAGAQGLANAFFRERDAATIEGQEKWRQRFDYICAFDAIHDQTHPLESLRSIRYMLAPGGLFSMVDIKAGSRHADNLDHPMGPFLYTVSLMHCMPVGLNDNGTGLGMMWGRQKAAALLKEAGFEHVEPTEMDYDPFNLHYLCRVSA